VPFLEQCDPHKGDSEWIMLELEEGNFGAGSWRVRNATLSAHWHAPAGGADNYVGPDLEYGNDVWLGRPLIWVAEGKHANYRSQSVCDAGAWCTDNCDRNSNVGETLDIQFARNLGRDANRLIQGPVYSLYGFPGSEDFWGASPFYGWWGVHDDEGSTTYRTILLWANYN